MKFRNENEHEFERLEAEIEFSRLLLLKSLLKMPFYSFFKNGFVRYDDSIDINYTNDPDKT